MIIGTDENLDIYIEDNKEIVLYFSAEWCVPCHRYSPIVEEVDKQYFWKIAKIDVDKNPLQSQKYNVSTIPTTIIIKNGVETNRITGAVPKHMLVKQLESWM